MYAASPAYSKHTADIKSLRPTREEILEAVRFVMNLDGSNPRKEDLRVVLKRVGFDFDKIHKELAREDRETH